MRNEFARFGQPDRFEIVIGWVQDADRPERRPAGHGWSMGHLELTIAGVSLTASRVGNDRQSYVGWYLGPMLDWLASNWASLLHEEDFAWPTKDAAVAAIACRRALDFWSSLNDGKSRDIYRHAQAWYLRHGLRSAAAGGLFPDLFIRRLADDIELSWSGEPPPFAPEALVFESGAGFACLAVEDVAGPLWQALQWVKSHPPTIDDSFRDAWKALCRKIDHISHISVQEFESAAIADELLKKVRASFARTGKSDLLNEAIQADRPYVKAFSAAIAMYGGVNPQLSSKDIDSLRDVLVSVEGGSDSPELAELFGNRGRLPVGGVPHEDGYRFAEQFLDDLTELFGDVAPNGFVDLDAIISQLSIGVQENRLETDSIRGVALAGEGFRPLILVNPTSVFNKSEEGKRFTRAHELCHILFDRTRARRIAHASGPWVSPGIEKRANAFAAYLLMPRGLLSQHFASAGDTEVDEVRDLARKLHVNETALVEHLYNLDFIDEIEREGLRSCIRRPMQ